MGTIILGSMLLSSALAGTWEVGAGVGAAGACGLGVLPELALCSPSDPMLAATARRRLVGPLRIGLDVTAQGHLPDVEAEFADAAEVNGLSPDVTLTRSTTALLAVLAPTVASNEVVSWAPLFTFGPGVSVMASPPEPYGRGGTRLVPSGFAGIGLRVGVLDRVGVEAELRHGLALSALEDQRLELEGVGSARLSAVVSLP